MATLFSTSVDGTRIAYDVTGSSRGNSRVLMLLQPFVWWACFQAMRSWPDVEPGDVGCPAMLLVGTKNKPVIEWVQANRDSLDGADVSVEVIEGLSHAREFDTIDRVFPVVSSFFKSRYRATTNCAPA